MFKIVNKQVKRFVIRMVAIMLALLLVGCSGLGTSGKQEQPTPSPDANQQEGTPPAEEEPKDIETPKPNEQPDSAGTAGESFGAYVEAKGEVIGKLSDALANNPGTELDTMSLLGVMMVDMMLLPATSFGLGEEVALSILGFLSAEDVAYSENGNQYSIKFKNAEGEQYELQGVYDKAADSLKCTVFVEGKESVVSEHRKTSFGYVGQIYSVNKDGSFETYQLALSGGNGVVGITEISAAPAALTGSEAADFPKACEEWYAIDGNDFTGVTSDGRELSFTYTPSDD